MAITRQAGFPLFTAVAVPNTVFTLSSVAVAAGTNTILVALIGIDKAAGIPSSVTGVTFNGDPFTFFGKGTHSSEEQAEIWYRLAPDVATGDVVVTIDVANEVGFGVLAYDGVSQASPWRSAAATNVGSTGTSSTVTPTGVVTGDVVVDQIAAFPGTGMAVGANQAQRWNQSGANMREAASTQNGVDGGAMSWSWSGNSSFSHVGGALAPAAGPLASDTPFTLLGRGASW